jgi:hypothetical protein
MFTQYDGLLRGQRKTPSRGEIPVDQKQGVTNRPFVNSTTVCNDVRKHIMTFWDTRRSLLHRARQHGDDPLLGGVVKRHVRSLDLSSLNAVIGVIEENERRDRAWNDGPPLTIIMSVVFLIQWAVFLCRSGVVLEVASRIVRLMPIRGYVCIVWNICTGSRGYHRGHANLLIMLLVIAAIILV